MIQTLRTLQYEFSIEETNDDLAGLRNCDSGEVPLFIEQIPGVYTLAVGVLPREDLGPDFWQAVGRLKRSPGGIALADCFCIALAQRVGGDAVTADPYEFDRLVPLGLCPILFIR